MKFVARGLSLTFVPAEPRNFKLYAELKREALKHEMFNRSRPELPVRIVREAREPFRPVARPQAPRAREPARRYERTGIRAIAPRNY